MFAAIASSSREEIPSYCGSPAGKCSPIVPRAAAPKRASMTACVSTSASEWPSRPRSWPTCTPPRTRRRPATSGCTSKPRPTLTGRAGVPSTEACLLLLADQRLQQLQVLRGGQLDVRRLTLDDRHGMAAGCHELRVVVTDQARIRRFEVGAREQAIGEGLRRLGEHETR